MPRRPDIGWQMSDLGVLIGHDATANEPAHQLSMSTATPSWSLKKSLASFRFPETPACLVRRRSGSRG